MASLAPTGLPSAGIFSGPAAWFLNTQISYALVPWICAHQIRLVPLVALGTMLVSLAGGLLSWLAFRRSSVAPELDSAGAGRPHRFTAIMGMSMAALFTAVILVQGSAGFVFHGCER
jgi:hypothetical protein